MLSVIIATKNRADALRNISLPSLLRQTSNNFEVLVWDASDGDDSCKVTSDLSEEFKNIGVILTYVKAPRGGSASQRNDAVKIAKDDVVFFIDDDCEIPIDGVRQLGEAFISYPWLFGAGLPLINKPIDGLQLRNVSLIHGLTRAVFHFFTGRSVVYRKVRASTFPILPFFDNPGYAEHLSGGCMALRRSVFDELFFDERLQCFGGYALGEDLDLSHRVFLCYRQPLLVLNSAPVIHHYASGGRPDKRKMCAAIFHNTKIIRDNFNKYAHYRLIPFILGQRICRVLGLIAMGYGVQNIFNGYMDYRRAMKDE